MEKEKLIVFNYIELRVTRLESILLSLISLEIVVVYSFK